MRVTNYSTRVFIDRFGWLLFGTVARKATAVASLLNALQSQTKAAQAVIDAREKGDLSAAVRALSASMQHARAAIVGADRTDT